MTAPQAPATLLRRLGTADAALIVMGGIIGSGIFMNPSVVAGYVHTGGLIILIWLIGGVIALIGAGLFAELAARRPLAGGLYAYLRDAFHPVVGFEYGWSLLLISQGGGIAASAVVFSAYFMPLTGWHISERLLAVILIAMFTILNCLGVRQGTAAQNLFMIVKIAAIAAFVIIGFIAAPAASSVTSVAHIGGGSLIVAMALALIPVFFSYNGYQTATFMTAELKAPERTLPRGLLIGVLAVVALYVAVNAACLHVLGPAGLADTSTPASAVAHVAFGPLGERFMAAVVIISTLGFISNQILTAPRVLFQMAADGALFRVLARVDPRTHVPVIAIVQQGVLAIIIALSGTYAQILTYVVFADFVFYALAGVALFIFRSRDRHDSNRAQPIFQMPGYPWTVALFIAISVAMIGVVILRAPREGLIGLLAILIGLPVYAAFARSSRVYPVET